jgi:hypothetical protein
MDAKRNLSEPQFAFREHKHGDFVSETVPKILVSYSEIPIVVRIDFQEFAPTVPKEFCSFPTHPKLQWSFLVIQLGVWRPHNTISGLPDSETEVNVVAGVWRLFVESANLFEDVFTNHHASAAHG